MNFNQTKSEWKVIGSVVIGYFIGDFFSSRFIVKVADTMVATPTGTLYDITNLYDWSFMVIPIAIVVVYIIWGLCQKKQN